MSTFNEAEFRRRVDKATETIRKILDRTRSPLYAADANHSYSDKFVLCNLLVRLALGSIFQGLNVTGISDADLEKMVAWSAEKTVSLRLQAADQCAFVKEKVREIESSAEVTTKRSRNSDTVTSTRKSVTKITEYEWILESKWELVAFRGVGSDAEEQISIISRTFSSEILTGAKVNPRYEHRVHPNLDVDVSWFLLHLNRDDGSVQFDIDREVESCRTPRRNKDIEDALLATSKLSEWCWSVRQFFAREVFAIDGMGVGNQHKQPHVGGISTDGVLVPVVPLFMEQSDPEEIGQLTFTPTDVAGLLSEQKRSLTERVSRVGATFADNADSAISESEVRICIVVDHLREVVLQLHQSVDYVEDMLRTQLYAAIGKHISWEDFNAFRRFHDRNLFNPETQPLPFSYTVRRSPLHSPEGLVGIEESVGSEPAQPVYTHVGRAEAAAPINFSINAATTVRVRGDRFLHAWLMHAFSGQPQPTVQLTAQARQLSSFIVMIGRITGPSTFEPKHAMIVHNKDDFRVPLNLETIPTPSEFKDAITSLSPEQQRFCREWRAMQLESTLFAVCVVQIKPLLERVLNLPAESLAKEIKLTQDLTELFTKYQIPADLLTAGTIDAAAADGFEVVGPAAADKVSEVKANVAAMMALIDAEKTKQLADASQAAVFNALAGSGSSEMEEEGLERAAGGQERSMLLSSTPNSMPAVRSMPLRSVAARMSSPATGLARAPAKRKRMSGAPAPPPPTLSEHGHQTVRGARGSMEGGALQGRLDGGAASSMQSTRDSKAPADTSQRSAVASPAAGESGASAAAVDYTQVPAELDRRLEALDSSSAVRPTIISAGERWTKKAMASLMSRAPTVHALTADGLREEKSKAFELLDALTRSGALTVEEASLHVVLAATHTFDRSLVDTVVQHNEDPVQQFERSSLIMSSCVLGKAVPQLVKSEHASRIKALTPSLFADSHGDVELHDAMQAAAISGSAQEG